MAEDVKHPINWLRENIGKPNLADAIPEDQLARLGSRVVYGYDIDKASRIDWEKKAEAGLDIAMQVMGAKTSPWPNCANVKHPLIAVAAIQFASRAYPNIVKGPDIVKARVVGEDVDGKKEARAKRISQHMSWQLTEQMEEWEEDTDKLLHSLPILGLYYRKTYYDPLLGRNRSEGRSPMRVVVNDDARDLETARRVTDEVYLYKNEVIERERAGLFVKDIHKQFKGDDEAKEQDLFLEQHCYEDLDGDGYEEPYIVTVHKESAKVARVIARYDADGVVEGKGGKVARIEPIHYFTKFPFLPAPNGKFHDLGFAQLLGPLNETINTLVNQLLDAGTLANLQGGFVGRGIKWQGGAMRFIPGEWKTIDVTGGILRDNIVPLPTKEPSGVLFQLLGSLTEMTDKLASVSEVMSGEMPSQNTPATTVLAMIEQGLKVFTSIYKRVFRSLTKEYKKLYRLNRLYLDEAEYYRVLDSQFAVYRADYDSSDLDIVPVADPTISSEAQRLARARAMFETLQVNPSAGGRAEILKRYYEALDVPELDKVLPAKEIDAIVKSSQAPPPPDPNMLKLEAEMLKQKHDYENAVEELAMKQQKQNVEIEQIKANIELTKANAIKAVAEAEAKEIGQQFELYRHEVEQLSNQVKLAIEVKDAKTREIAARAKTAGQSESGDSASTDAGSPGGMEEQSADQGSIQIPAPDQGLLPGPVGGGGNLEPQLGGANGPGNVPDLGAGIGPDDGSGVATA